MLTIHALAMTGSPESEIARASVRVQSVVEHVCDSCHTSVINAGLQSLRRIVNRHDVHARVIRMHDHVATMHTLPSSSRIEYFVRHCYCVGFSAFLYSRRHHLVDARSGSVSLLTDNRRFPRREWLRKARNTFDGRSSITRVTRARDSARSERAESSST